MLNKIYTAVQIILLPIAGIFSLAAGMPIDDYPSTDLQRLGVSLFLWFGYTSFLVLFSSFLARMLLLRKNKTYVANIVGLAPIINILGIIIALRIYGS